MRQFLMRSRPYTPYWRPGIAGFRPSVTGRAWGKTGARTAGGTSAVLRGAASASLGHATVTISVTTQRHEMSLLRI